VQNNQEEFRLVRPAKWRCLECLPGSKLFGPVGVRASSLEKLRISFDELEALRLLHLEGITQAEAGSRIGVSGSTVSRMADRAHRVLTEALVSDKAVCVEGGPVTVVRVSKSTTSDQSPGSLREQAEVSKPNEGETMIVAVPYLEGDVNAHFGSTRAFLIAETEDGKVGQTTLSEVQGMQHNHAGIAGFLKEQGVSVILAGGMGGPMQQALKAQGFELYCGVSGPAMDAVQAFLAGGIEQSDATCGHHHGEN
jgi:predicted DNA-binding protein (UPF0251 family)/predicted Fe-Mo cluster-binding NifX family protein